MNPATFAVYTWRTDKFAVLSFLTSAIEEFIGECNTGTVTLTLANNSDKSVAEQVGGR